VKSLMKTLLKRLRPPPAMRTCGEIPRVQQGFLRDDDRSLLLSAVSTVLLSAACLIVLWLQWEKGDCQQGQSSTGQCVNDSRPENTGMSGSHRHTVHVLNNLMVG